MSLTQINKAGLDEIALDHVFTIGASGSSAYTFQGEGLNGTVNNPTLYLTRGKTYRFENGSGGHPIRIQSTSGASGTAYNTGVTNNAGSGTVIVEVQHDAPDVLYYQCTSHAAMNGILYITGALADGGVTTAKIADDAVNNDKLANSVVAAIAANTAKTSNATHTGDVTGSTSLTIAAGAVTEAKLDTNAVTTNKIANSAINQSKLADASINAAKIQDQQVTLAKLPHGTSSNDGKFLRANNGADPSFESIPAGITISNQADNRIITATATTDTLNAESNVVIDANGNVGIGTTSPESKLAVKSSTGASDLFSISDTTVPTTGAEYAVAMLKTGYNYQAASITNYSTYGQGLRIYNNGGAVGRDALVCVQAGGTRLTVNEDVTVNTGNLIIGTSGKGIDFGATSNAGTGTPSEILDDYEVGTWSPVWSNAPSGGTTTTSNNMYGRYVKIGKIVHAYFYTWGLPSGNSGNMYLQGFPFTAASNPGAYFAAVQSAFYNFGDDHYYNLGVRIHTNQTYAELIFCRDNSGNYVAAEFSGFINYYTNFIGTLTYETT